MVRKMSTVAARRITAGVIAGALLGAFSLTVTASSADPDFTAAEARQLCLAPLPPTTKQITPAATKTPETSKEWVERGWNWVRRARLAGDPGFYVNVSGCVAEALRDAPGHAGALELRGVVLMNAHRFAEAREQANGILASDPFNATALGTLSDAALELGRFDEAVDAAQRSADARPDSASYARAAWFRWLTGDKEGAKRFLRSALEGRDPRDPEPTAWVLVEAAKMLWNEADYDGADLVVDEALRWVPDYPPALAAKGRVALSRNQPGNAAIHLEKALRAQPLAETAWLLADARAMSGDAAGAAAEEKRVEDLGRRGDRLTLALFYATRNRNIDEALRLIDEERAGRGGVYIDDTYAWVLYRAGRIDEALCASRQAMKLGTPDARILYHAGAIEIAAGSAAGRDLVAKALAIHPGFDRTGAVEARTLLSEASPFPSTPALQPIASDCANPSASLESARHGS